MRSLLELPRDVILAENAAPRWRSLPQYKQVVAGIALQLSELPGRYDGNFQSPAAQPRQNRYPAPPSARHRFCREPPAVGLFSATGLKEEQHGLAAAINRKQRQLSADSVHRLTDRRRTLRRTTATRSRAGCQMPIAGVAPCHRPRYFGHKTAPTVVSRADSIRLVGAHCATRFGVLTGRTKRNTSSRFACNVDYTVQVAGTSPHRLTGYDRYLGTRHDLKLFGDETASDARRKRTSGRSTGATLGSVNSNSARTRLIQGIWLPWNTFAGAGALHFLQRFANHRICGPRRQPQPIFPASVEIHRADAAGTVSFLAGIIRSHDGRNDQVAVPVRPTGRR